ncbi:MAG: gamma-glutamyltransferase [Tissierellales bacterium]|nr:gamma-glutamyltransferase [Tissierellales bacterium]MBN2827375.1 gamma-glutamyltransferase [Tissierellales bacterium]
MKRKTMLFSIVILVISMILTPAFASQTYTVQYGDTLGRIGDYFGIDYLKIAEDNDISNVNLIFVGQKLFIDTGENDSPTDQYDQPHENGQVTVEEYVFELSDQDLDLTVRDATGTNGAVSAANPVASKIGLEILKQGGNAFDASVGMAFAMSLLEPHASGLGGGGFAIVHIEEDNQQLFYDYGNAAPKAFTRELYRRLPDDNPPAGVAAIVPGAVSGWLKIQEDHGLLELEEVLRPVIYMAENGFEITPALYATWFDSYETIIAHEETAKVFTDGGLSYFEGQTFKNQDYADVLHKIIAEGVEGFYGGEVAEKIVSSVRAEGGVMTLEDLANYEVEVREPVNTTYRGHKVVSAAPSSRGGAAIMESLNMAELYDVEAMGHNTSETLNLWAEIFKLATIDSYNYLGDIDNYQKYTDPLTSKEYAKTRAALIDLDNPALIATKGYPDEESASTTHLVATDQYGNAVSMTNTLGHYFGSGITVSDCGFLLNDHAYNFSETVWPINFPNEGKRARSTMSPVIVFDEDGDFMAAIGTPGGATIVGINAMLVSGLIDFGMDIQDIINAPRIYQDYVGSLEMEESFDLNTIEELKDIGHKVWVHGVYGGAQGIVYDKLTNTFRAGADFRRDGKALAY